MHYTLIVKIIYLSLSTIIGGSSCINHTHACDFTDRSYYVLHYGIETSYTSIYFVIINNYESKD